ncbi:MAG: arginine repressor [Caldicoprobacterales bacterium]|jgi:transcriptional regulator of arginine metabolism|nr:arginine repressor [Clostridiales bacterium]
MKYERHAMILKIIEEKDIETQEELAAELRMNGMDVTQATVSRDIKELRLVKVLGKSGVYKYAAMERTDSDMSERLFRVFSDSVISMDFARNLIVIRTIVAGAQAAASAIDSMNWPEIIGCIAGDDTILVVVREDSMVPDVLKRFSKLMRQ